MGMLILPCTCIGLTKVSRAHACKSLNGSFSLHYFIVIVKIAAEVHALALLYLRGS